MCDVCDNTGWRYVDRAVTPRECRMPRPLIAHSPSDGNPAKLAKMDGATLKVREIILRHRGELRAVTVGEICDELRMNARAVKAAVSKLVTKGGMLIGSSRDDDPGYFVIESSDELDRQRAHVLKHCLSWFKRLKSLDPDGAAIRTLYGQMGLEQEKR